MFQNENESSVVLKHYLCVLVVRWLGWPMSLWLMLGLKYSSAVTANGFVAGHDIWVTIVCWKTDTHTHTLLWGYRSDIILKRHFRCLDDKLTDSWQAPFTHSVVRPHVLFSDTQEGLQRCLAAWDKNAIHSRSYYRRRAQSQGSVLHHSNSRQETKTPFVWGKSEWA